MNCLLFKFFLTDLHLFQCSGNDPLQGPQMLSVHQRKYSSVNELQDNFAFLALVVLLNPSTSTWDGTTLLVPNPGKPQPVIHKVAVFYKTHVSGEMQIGLYIPSWCTYPTNP